MNVSKKTIGLLLVCVLAFLSNHAQHPGFSKFYRYEGNAFVRADLITDIVYDNTNNNLFFSLIGYSSNGTLSVLFKTDMAGNVMKSVVDSVAFGIVYWNTVLLSKDGKYVYWGGHKGNYNDTASSRWIVRKTDKNLNVMWDKAYPFNTLQGINYSMIELDSGNLLLDCFKYTNPNDFGVPTQTNHVFLRKIDSMGNELAIYTPNTNERTNSYKNVNSEEAGGCLFNGTTYSGGNRGYVTKMNPDGSEAWTRSYNANASDCWYLSMDKGKEPQEYYYNCGQVAFNGTTTAPSLLNKMNAQGDVVWEKTSYIQPGNNECFFDTKAIPNYNVIAAGQSQFLNENIGRGMLVLFDKDGNQKWSKIYKNAGNLEESYFNKVISLPDGGFITAGTSFAQDGNGEWSADGWLMRVDSNGCYNADCSGLLSVKKVELKSDAIKIYPNPTSGILHLERSTLFPKGTTVTLLDYLGRVVKTLPSPANDTKIQYDLKGLAPNVYFLKIEADGEIVQRKITVGN